MQQHDQSQEHHRAKRFVKLKKRMHYIQKSMAKSVDAGLKGVALGGPFLFPITGITVYSVALMKNYYLLSKDGVKLNESEDLQEYLKKITDPLKDLQRSEVEERVLAFYKSSIDKDHLKNVVKNLSDDGLKLLYSVNRFAKRGTRKNANGISPEKLQEYTTKYTNRYENSDKTNSVIKYDFSIKMEQLLEEIKHNEKLSQTLKSAMKLKDLKTIQEVLSDHPKLEIYLENGKRPLHVAFINSNFELAKLFCKSQSDLNVVDDVGKKPLDYAKDPEFLNKIHEFLKDTKALKKELNRSNLDWETIDKMIEKDVNLNIRDDLGDSLLHKAALSGKVDVIQKCLKKGADVNVRNEDGMTPLYVSIGDPDGGGDREVVKILLENGANPNAQTNVHYKNNTPLHNAAIYMVKSEIFELLLKHGANPLMENKDGKVFLELARDEKQAEIIRLLRKKPHLVKEDYKKTNQNSIRLHSIRRRSEERGHVI